MHAPAPLKHADGGRRGASVTNKRKVPALSLSAMTLLLPEAGSIHAPGGVSVQLDRPEVFLGRETCGLRDAKVSRRQLRVTTDARSGSAVLHATGAVNVSYVRSAGETAFVPLPAGASRPLRHGDEICLLQGLHLLRVRLPPRGPKRPAAADATASGETGSGTDEGAGVGVGGGAAAGSTPLCVVPGKSAAVATGDAAAPLVPPAKRARVAGGGDMGAAAAGSRGRAPCKYGARCYRKNPAHLAEFSHDAGDLSVVAPAATAAVGPSIASMFGTAACARRSGAASGFGADAPAAAPRCGGGSAPAAAPPPPPLVSLAFPLLSVGPDFGVPLASALPPMLDAAAAFLAAAPAAALVLVVRPGPDAAEVVRAVASGVAAAALGQRFEVVEGDLDSPRFGRLRSRLVRDGSHARGGVFDFIRLYYYYILFYFIGLMSG